MEAVKNIFSLDEMKDKPDFVIISNPTGMHKASVMQVLELGCPIFIEKPVFNDLNNIDELIKEMGLEG